MEELTRDGVTGIVPVLDADPQDPPQWFVMPKATKLRDAKEAQIGARMINARVETVHEKPAFRRAFLKRRCLLPADGFYEWVPGTDPATGKARKQPYFIHPEDEQVMALARLYEYWRDPAVTQDDDPAAWLMSCTIITTEATDAADHVHPRMPLALTEDHYDAWLDPTHHDADELRALLEQPAGRDGVAGPRESRALRPARRRTARLPRPPSAVRAAPRPESATTTGPAGQDPARSHQVPPSNGGSVPHVQVPPAP